MRKRPRRRGPQILDYEHLMREAGVRLPDAVGRAPGVMPTSEAPGWRDRLRASWTKAKEMAPRANSAPPAPVPPPAAARPPAPRPPAVRSPMPATPSNFADLLEANQRYANSFPHIGFDGLASAGIAVVTCMDSRIDPLGMLGLKPGDAKIIRNPGGRVSRDAIEGLVLGANLLGVRRILVIAHTRCAMCDNTDTELRRHVSKVTGVDASWQSFHTFRDPAVRLREDVQTLRAHPLIPAAVTIGGFVYDVETGRLRQLA